jgi:hypothetical protein
MKTIFPDCWTQVGSSDSDTLTESNSSGPGSESTVAVVGWVIGAALIGIVVVGAVLIRRRHTTVETAVSYMTGSTHLDSGAHPTSLDWDNGGNPVHTVVKDDDVSYQWAGAPPPSVTSTRSAVSQPELRIGEVRPEMEGTRETLLNQQNSSSLRERRSDHGRPSRGDAQ